MKSDDSKRFMVCGNRYEQRRARGKVGWADEASYLMFQRRLDDILSSSSLPSSIRFLYRRATSNHGAASQTNGRPLRTNGRRTSRMAGGRFY
ncbi:TPA: hypothetical protein EYP66_24545 [Candidatus Poribacteria bacterium]|nr:hypothetical protein [Candidatus Poribacteria bacterium]